MAARLSVPDIFFHNFLPGCSFILGNVDFHDERTFEAKKEDRNIVYSIGIHPKFARDLFSLDLAGFALCVKSGGFVAVGETGICSKWVSEKKNPAPLPLQLKLFHFHILLSKASGLPLILHLR